jgi:hypothetical protein
MRVALITSATRSAVPPVPISDPPTSAFAAAVCELKVRDHIPFSCEAVELVCDVPGPRWTVCLDHQVNLGTPWVIQALTVVESRNQHPEWGTSRRKLTTDQCGHDLRHRYLELFTGVEADRHKNQRTSTSIDKGLKLFDDRVRPSGEYSQTMMANDANFRLPLGDEFSSSENLSRPAYPRKDRALSDRSRQCQRSWASDPGGDEWR